MRSLVIGGLTLLVIGAPWAPQAGAQPAYDTLPRAKAMAVAPARPDAVQAVVEGQPHDLAASVAAREQCQAKARPGEACEVVRLNDERITSGREILARVPAGPHPLFLWHFQRGQTEVFLAGSIHVLKPSLYPLPAQFDAAFERADYLVLEVDISALPPNEMQQRTLQHALLADQQSLSDVLPAALHARLERHLAGYGMTTAMLSRAKPALVMNQIVVSRLLTLGYLPDSGVESHFLSRRSGQQVLELESLEAQLALLFDQPMATQVELLDETLEVADQIEPLLADMLVAWLAGDDQRFLEAFKAQSGDSPESRAFTRALLEDRNHTMAASIRGFLESGSASSYFVLVGAAHLVGEEGIVPLLARQGVTGRRVMSTDALTGARRTR
jgi:uncharacterized protein YbaP (TraB family)